MLFRSSARSRQAFSRKFVPVSRAAACLRFVLVYIISRKHYQWSDVTLRISGNVLQARCIAEVTVKSEKAQAPAKQGFDFKRYMGERAQLIDAALDKSVPLQYPEIINESMRYSLLAGG